MSPRQNVLARVSPTDFGAFVERFRGGARLARGALDTNSESESGALWRELFGPRFPRT